MELVVKNLPARTGDIRDVGSIPGLGRSPGGGNGNPLQYPCLENPIDRGAWWATVHEVAKSQTQLERFSMHACSYLKYFKVIYCSLCPPLLMSQTIRFVSNKSKNCHNFGVVISIKVILRYIQEL